MAATKPANAKNTANNETMEGKAEDLPDFSKWTPHQIGFAPYWRAKEKGDWCYMQIVAKDMRNPDFIRYQCTALKDTMCRRGPGNDDAEAGDVGEQVMVKKGDAFSISVYHSLREEFDFFLYALMEHNIEVPMRLTALKKTKTKHKDGRSVWNWELLSDPLKRPALESHRKEFLKLVAAEAERAQLEESTEDTEG